VPLQAGQAPPTVNLAYTESSQDIIRVSTDKETALASARRWDGSAQLGHDRSVETRCAQCGACNDLPAGRRLLVLGTAKIRCRRCRGMLCAGTVCLPRSKRCRIRQKKRSLKLESIWTAVRRGPGHFRRRATTAADVVETFALRVFAEPQPACRCPHRCECADRFPTSQYGHAVSQRGFRPFPWPKCPYDLPQCGQQTCSCFSDHAENFHVYLAKHFDGLRTSATPRRGVVTRTAPVTATVLNPAVNCTSPVPGGRSMIVIQLAHSTLRECVITLCSIGRARSWAVAGFTGPWRSSSALAIRRE